jgi:hypothetical protein
LGSIKTDGEINNATQITAPTQPCFYLKLDRSVNWVRSSCLKHREEIVWD